MTLPELEMATVGANGAGTHTNGIEDVEGYSAAAPVAMEEEHTLRTHALWLAATVVIHAMWGIYPVVARWLQTRASEPLPALRLTFYINFFACLSLAAAFNAPRLACRLRRQAAARAATAEESQPIVSHSFDRLDAIERPSKRQAVGDVAVLAVSLGVLAAGAVFASRLTSAYWVQLVFSTSPLITAVVGSLTAHEPWPPKLWETLGLTLLGSALVVAGGLHSSSYTATWKDPLGIAVALAATTAISVYFVWVAKTESWLGEDRILYINYASVFLFAPVCSALFEGGRWNAILHWRILDWTALLYEAAGVYGIAKFTQQLIIRRLGATVYAMFISIRLVAAIAGSYVVLGEKIGSGLEAFGMVVVCLSVTWYLYVQWQAARTEAAVLGRG